MADGTFQHFPGQAMGEALSAGPMAQVQASRDQQRQNFEMQKMAYENDRLDNRQMLRNQGKDSSMQNIEQLQKKQEEMEAARKEELKAKETSRAIAFNNAVSGIYKNGLNPQNIYEINSNLSQSEPSIALQDAVNKKFEELDLKDPKILKALDPNRTPSESVQLLSVGVKNPNNTASNKLINYYNGLASYIENNSIMGRFKNLVTNGQLGADFSMKSENGKDEFLQAKGIEYLVQNLSNGNNVNINDLRNAYVKIPGEKDNISLVQGITEYVFGEGALNKITEGLQGRVDSLLKDQDRGNKDFNSQKMAIQDKIVELESKLANKAANLSNKVDKLGEVTDGLTNNQTERENAIVEKTTEIDELVKREDSLTEEEATKLANLRTELESLNKEHNKNKQLQDKVNRESENTTTKYDNAQAHSENVSSAEWYTDSNDPDVKEMVALKNELRTLEQTQKEFNKGHESELKELNEQYKNTRESMEETALELMKKDPDILELVMVDGSSYGDFDKNGNFIGDNLYSINNLSYNSYESLKTQQQQLLDETLAAQEKFTKLATLKNAQAQNEGAYMQQQGYNQTAFARGAMQGNNELNALGIQNNQLMRGEELAQGQHQIDLINQDTAGNTAATNNMLNIARNDAILKGDPAATTNLGARQDALAQGDFTSGKAGGVGMNPPMQTNTVVDGGQKLQGTSGLPSAPAASTTQGTPTTTSVSKEPTQDPAEHNKTNMAIEFTAEQENAVKNGDYRPLDRAIDNIFKKLVEDKNYDYNLAFNDLEQIAERLNYKSVYNSPLVTKTAKGKILMKAIDSKYASDTSNAEQRTADNTENLRRGVRLLKETQALQSIGTNIGTEILQKTSDIAAKLGIKKVSNDNMNRSMIGGELTKFANAINAAIRPAVSTGSSYVNKDDSKNAFDFKGINSISDLLMRMQEGIGIAEVALQTRVKNGNAIDAAKAKDGLADIQAAKEYINIYTHINNKGHFADAKIAIGTGNGNFYVYDNEVYQVDGKGVSKLGNVNSPQVRATAAKTPDLARIIKGAK